MRKMDLKRACIVLIAIQTIIGHEVLMEEKHFCGDSISYTLERFCIKYFSPEMERRVKRQIVEECCKKACSTHNLMANYCEVYDREALIEYLKELKRKGENLNEEAEIASLNKRRRRRRRISRRV